MIENIIDYSLKNKLMVGLMMLTLICWGGYSLVHLPIDAVPDITDNQVQIITVSPNLAANEVEQYITYPIELAVASVPQITQTRSMSRFGLSVVTIVFEDRTDVYWARAQITERLKQVEGDIPPGAGTPELAPVSTGLGEIFQYTIHAKDPEGKKYSLTELRTIQDWIVRRQLLGVEGVADVSSFGGYLKQYQVRVDPNLLKSFSITLDDVFTALEEGNANTGASYIEKENQMFFIRGLGMMMGDFDIENTVITENRGVPVLIKDIGTVEEGYATRYGAMTRNAEGETVGALILMLKGANGSTVIQNVKRRINDVEKSLPENLVIDPFIDREKLVKSAVHTVSTNLIEGALIVLAVLVLFFGSVRSGLVVASVIPLSMLFAFVMMRMFNVSGNLMSLGAIDFGLIVDSTIIIVENILRRFHLNHREGGGHSKQNVVGSATKEMMQSATFGQIIIFVVYIPILALTGIAGKMFQPMALTVTFALIGAFILSLTYVPVASVLFLKEDSEEKANFTHRYLEWMQTRYRKGIEYALDHKAAFLGGSLVLSVGAMFVYLNLGGVFIPRLDEGDYAIETRLPQGSSLNSSIAATQKLQRLLLDSLPSEISSVTAKVGASEIPTDPMPIEAFDLIVTVKDKKEWKEVKTKDELTDRIYRILHNVPGLYYSVQQPIEMRFNELMTGARTEVVVQLFGNNLDVLTQKGNEIAAAIKNIEGIVDLNVQKIAGLPQLQIRYNRQSMAHYGISVGKVNDFLSTAFAGKKAGVIYEDDSRFDLVVKFADASRKEIADLENLMISTADGTTVPMSQIATVELRNGPSEISREQSRRKIDVGFNTKGRDVESIVDEARAEIEKKVKIPPGYSVAYGGQFENLINARARLSIVVPLALLIIFMLLFITFKNLTETLIIFTAIPFSAVGGIFFLWARGMPFSISAGVGFIALFGIAVLNGIVLISYLNQLHGQGIKDIRERVLTGVTNRFRSIIMTGIVPAIGFVPMALSKGSGAEVQKPLATVVIGGLFTATFLTLFILPILYSIFMRKRAATSKGVVAHASLILGLALLGWPLTTQAQEAMLSMDQACELMLKNSNTLKMHQENLHAEKKPFFTLPDPQVGLESPSGKEMRLTVQQEFAFPTVYLKQKNLIDGRVALQNFNLIYQRQQLIKDLKLVYAQVQYGQAKADLYGREDSLLEKFSLAMGSKYEVGETGLLEKLTAQSRYLMVAQRYKNAKIELEIAHDKLKKMIGDNGSALRRLEPFHPLAPPDRFDALDSTLRKSTLLDYHEQKAKVEEGSLRLEQQKIFPSFYVGYFNQTDFQPDLLYQMRFGLTVPLWFWTHAGDIGSARHGWQAAQYEYRQERNNLAQERRRAAHDIKRLQGNLEFYTKTGLPIAESILNSVRKMFALGETDYQTVFLSINQSLETQFEYLEAVLEYNQSVIEFTALTQ